MGNLQNLTHNRSVIEALREENLYWFMLCAKKVAVCIPLNNDRTNQIII